MGSWGNKRARAVEPLIEALKDKESTVRSDSAEAIGKIGDKRAVEPLTKALRDKDEDVREKAAVALGKKKDAIAIRPPQGGQSTKQKPTSIGVAICLHILSWPFLIIGGIGLVYTIIPFLFTNTQEMTDKEIWPMLLQLIIGVALAGAFIGIGSMLRFFARKIKAKIY